jgi:uncharacterized repeat protein (TIGR01451 family)
MNPRTRNILVIVILLIIIVAGGVGVYFVTRQIQLGTGVGLTTEGDRAIDISPYLKSQGLLTGDPDISWLGGCLRTVNGQSYDPSNPSVWNKPLGSSITVDFACPITDNTVAHKLEVDTYTFRSYVYILPNGEPCRDQDDVGANDPWPVYNGEDYGGELIPMISNQIHLPFGATCEDLTPTGATNIQEAIGPTNIETIDIPVGATEVTFSSTHAFNNCDYYQYDVIAQDKDAGNDGDWELKLGEGYRSFGSPAQCGFVAPPQVGSLEIKVFNDKNRDNLYGANNETDPAGEGAEFAGKIIEIRDSQGVLVDYNTKCDNGNQLGGAGRAFCHELKAGEYEVNFVGEDLSVYNKTPDTLHNPNSQNPLTVTVPGDGTAIADFGYLPKIVGGGQVGDLEIRIYEEKAPLDDEYTENTGEGAVFAGKTYTLIDSQGTAVDPGKCDNGMTVGGAGRDICRDLPIGDYTVNIDPDITTHTGPEPEQHNPNGDDPYTLNVPVGEVNNGTHVIADFQYLPRIIVGQGACTLTAAPQQVQVNQPVTFTATHTPVSTVITQYVWDYQDGTAPQTTTTPTVQHAFTTPRPSQPYDVVVTLFVGTNEFAQCNVPVTVIAGPISAALVCDSLTASPSQVQINNPVTFTATHSPSNFQITSYDWDFGDGSASTQTTTNTTTHTYTTARPSQPYVATVTLTGIDGQTASCTANVTVIQGPITPGLCRLEMVDYMDLDRDLTQDAGIIGYIEPGMDGARISVTGPNNFSQTVTTAQVGINRYGEAILDDIPCGDYTLTIDETSQVTVGGTARQVVLNRLQRLEPPTTSIQATLDSQTPGVRVEFGYIDRVIVAFTCTLDKTVTDTTANDEGTPDDPKRTNSAPGERLTYTINWDCEGFPETGPLSQSVSIVITDDFFDSMLTIVPGSITGGGVLNQSQGIITWTATGATNVDQGSVSFQADIDSPLAPGTYLLPNYVTLARDGNIVAQDQTLTVVVVPTDPNDPEFPDIEVIKIARDLNGGTLVPGDTIEYDIIVWNAGNVPLLNVRVTDNVAANLGNFDVVQIPQGATDNSVPNGGTNGTGFLDVSGFALQSQGDTATIIYTATVNPGVPGGTQIRNLVTAASGNVSDTDDETVVVGAIIPSAGNPPPAGPGPTSNPVAGSTGPALPPVLSPRSTIPGDEPAQPEATPETGVSAQTWALLISLAVTFGLAGYLIIRSRIKTAQE